MGIMPVLVIIVGGLLFCCVVPILRSFVIKAIVKQMSLVEGTTMDNDMNKYIELAGDPHDPCPDWPPKLD